MVVLLLFHAVLEFNPISHALCLASLAFVSLCCIAYVIVYPQTKIIGSYNLMPMLYLLALLAYNLLTYLWAIDRLGAISYNWSIIRYVLLFVIYSNLFRNSLIRARSQWLMVGLFAVYLGWAIFEMLTLQHAPNSRYYGVKHFIPTGAFVGENMLAAYMMILLPFVVYIVKVLKSKVAGVLVFLTTIFTLLIITIQGARIALIGILLFLGFFFFLRIKSLSKVLIIAYVLLLSLAVYTMFKQPVQLFTKMFLNAASTIGSETASVKTSSIKIRQQLIVEAVEICAESGFMGVGGGNFEHMMHAGRLTRTGWITNAHNYFLEILGNWGLLFFLGYLALFMAWYMRIFMLYRQSTGVNRIRYEMFLWSMFLLVPAMVLPSSIRHDGLVWIYLALINSVSQERIAN